MPDVREIIDRARVVELINAFDDKLDKYHYAENLRLGLKRILLLVKTTSLTTSCLIMISWTTLKEKTTMKTVTTDVSGRS